MKALLLSSQMRYRQVMFGLAGMVILLAMHHQAQAQYYPRADDSVRSKKTNSDPWPTNLSDGSSSDLSTRPSQNTDATRIPDHVGKVINKASKSTRSVGSRGTTQSTKATNQKAFGGAWPAHAKTVVPFNRFLGSKKQTDEYEANSDLANQEPAKSNLQGPQNRQSANGNSRSIQSNKNTFGSAWPANSKTVDPLNGFLGPKKKTQSPPAQSRKRVSSPPGFRGPQNRPSTVAKNSRSTQPRKDAFGSAWPDHSKTVAPLNGFLGSKKQQTNSTQFPNQAKTAPSFKGPVSRPSSIEQSSASPQKSIGNAWPARSNNVKSAEGRTKRNKKAEPAFSTWPKQTSSSKPNSSKPKSYPRSTRNAEDQKRVTVRQNQKPQPRYFSHLTAEQSTTPRSNLSAAVETENHDSSSNENQKVFSPVTNRQLGWQSRLDSPTHLADRTGDPVVPFRIESNYRRQDLYNNTLEPAPRRRRLDSDPTELPWSNNTFDSNERMSSEVSPNHWGSLGQEVAGKFDADEQDPPVYDPATDFNRPRTSGREVWYHGRKYFSYDLMFVEPRFQENTALLISDTNSDRSVSSDFKLNVGNRIGMAFESKCGPGVELFYSELDQTSRVSATSSGTTTICSHVFLAPSSFTLALATLAPNHTITVTQSTDLQYFDFGFFKFLQFPIASLSGHLGVRYAEIDHEHHASLTDAGGSVIGVLNQQSDYRGFGPRLGVTYVRPIGCGGLRLVGSMAGSVLAGDRDHRADDSTGYTFVNDSSEKVISAVDMRLGVEWAYDLNSISTVSARFAYESQHWFNGGTPVDPNSSFGLSGMIFGIGFVR